MRFCERGRDLVKPYFSHNRDALYLNGCQSGWAGSHLVFYFPVIVIQITFIVLGDVID